MTDAPLSSDRLLSMVEDLVIHSENASATRLHPPLPSNQLEELQFHWEVDNYQNKTTVKKRVVMKGVEVEIHRGLGRVGHRHLLLRIQ